jgi:ABC-type multidrug transport system fused ATPase/permease subunit
VSRRRRSDDPLRPYFTREWRALSGASGMTVLLTAADLAKPWPIKIVIDELFGGRTGSFTLTASDWRLLVAVALLVLAIALVEAFAEYFSDLWLQSAGERIAHRLRTAVYSHLQRLSLRFHQSRQKGDLVTRVTGDVDSIGDLFAQSLGSMAQSGLLLVGMIAVTLFLDPLLAAVSCAVVPLLAWLSVSYRQRIRASAKRQRAQDGEIASRATEALAAMPAVKAFGSEALEAERVAAPSALRMALGIQVSRLQARFDGLLSVFTAVGTALVIVVGVVRVASGVLTPGDLVVFTSYARKVNTPLRSLAREATKAMRTLARADRIRELLRADDVLPETAHAYRGGRARGRIELERVSFGYTDDRPVLDDVTLHIAPGEHVAIIGPSGAGKSTLGALVARFHDPAGGRVLIDGRDAKACSLTWLREQVGVLLQDTMLFSGTVESNIAYGWPASRDEIAAAARLAAADDFLSALPDGYETELGPQGAGLSGGQRQRLGIARMLLRDPAILVLDEPTTGLDAESEAQVLAGLRRLMRGRTALIITHSLELARTADRVLLVEDGGIAADGAPADVLGPKLRPPRRRRSTAMDVALPGMESLLDRGTMTDVLARSLRGAGQPTGVEVERVMYRPGRRLRTHYVVDVAGERHHAVAWIDADADLGARVNGRAWRELADLAAGRAPGEQPVTYDPELRAVVSWLPFDAALPALAVPAPAMAHLLRQEGLAIEDDEPVELLRYKPGERATLRVDGHVLKAYGNRESFGAALHGLRALPGVVPTARLAAQLPALRVVAQTRVCGRRPEPSPETHRQAGALAWQLHAAPVVGLPASGPEKELRAARAKARLAGRLVPELRPRLERLVALLEERLPAGGLPVAVHGDFHVEQLLALVDGGLAMLDLDDMRYASPALDLATYAADEVRGLPGDGEAIAAALEPLLAGYGERPADLEWHLAAVILTKACHPFRRLVDDWPARVEGMVASAEQAFGPKIRPLR